MGFSAYECAIDLNTYTFVYFKLLSKNTTIAMDLIFEAIYSRNTFYQSRNLLFTRF